MDESVKLDIWEPIPDVISAKLANLCFVAACLVVTIHVPQDGAVMFNTFLGKGLSPAMVPVFFLISGIFASDGMARYGWPKLMSKKFKTLVLPYLLLNIIVYCLACIDLLNGKAWSFSPKMTEISIHTFLLSLGIAKTRWCLLGPLWYVRCLTFFFCILPILWWALAHRRKIVP